jgi:hypothetical protein
MLSSENRALLVGIEDYNHSKLNLKGPVKDVDLMREIAVKIGFKENQIKVLLDKQATKALILDAFRTWLINGTGVNDKILFYYSGHGAQVADKDNDEDDGCDEALVPSDISISPGAMIVDDEINELLKQVKAREMLIVLDSCHSGTATRGISLTRSKGNKLFSYGKMIVKSGCHCNQPVNRKSLSLIEGKNLNQLKYIVLGAAAQNEVAQAAMRRGEGSVFTQCLYDIIKYKQGLLTFSDLRDLLSEKIKEKTVQFNRPSHTPQLEGNTSWFNKNFLEFAKKDMEELREQGYEGGIQHASGNTELFDRFINKRHFAVEIKSKKGAFSLGERIEFTAKSSKNGYLNIIELDPAGNIVVLFPNEFSRKKNIANKIKAWQDIKVPGSIGGFKFNAIEPVGTSRVIALVTQEPLDLFEKGIGRITGRFRSISNNDFKALKRSTLRAIGITADEEEPGTINKPPSRPEESQIEFGAGDIEIKVVK